MVANGRNDWTGWVDLTRERITARAVENTARAIREIDADIVGVVEAEDRITLKRFSDTLLTTGSGNGEQPLYPHGMVIDGNDARGIDVSVLAKVGYPIQQIRWARRCDPLLNAGLRLVWVPEQRCKNYGKQSWSESYAEAHHRLTQPSSDVRRRRDTAVLTTGLDDIRGLRIRLLGDRVLQDHAWRIAAKLNWPNTYQAKCGRRVTEHAGIPPCDTSTACDATNELAAMLPHGGTLWPHLLPDQLHDERT